MSSTISITESDRGYYGNDECAINRHAWREYSVDGLSRVSYVIDKNLSMLKPYYEISVVFKGVSGVLTTLKHSVPEGTTWKNALPTLLTVIESHAAGLLSNT